jgi:dTDP-4-dehydrorhamnose 3,5-epimerase
MADPDFQIEEVKDIPGAYLVSYDGYRDHRGDIYSTYHEKLGVLLGHKFKHDKFSLSKRGVIRAFHGDEKSTKLVTCVFGKIRQVIVDYRQHQPTYLNTLSVTFGAGTYQSLLIPPGVLNGYAVLSEHAVYHYKYSYHGTYNSVAEQISVKWDDPEINYSWPFENPILSDRDK